MGREGPGYISPEVQREAIERWAAYKGVEVSAWHVDEDWSGGTHERPGLELAVERAVSGETGGIVAWKIDRFSRYTEHGLRDLRRLQEADARLAFTVEDIDTSGPMGKFVYTVMLAMAEYFLDTIKVGWMAAKGRALDRGAKIGPTPFGYRRREDSTLEPHPERAAYLAEAFKLARHGVQPVVAYLDGLGLIHEEGKRAGRPLVWTAFTVRRLLANRSYLGEQHYGDDVREGAYEALVTRSVWEAAQHEPEERRQAPADFPLSGVASCSSCGGPMVGGRGGRNVRTYRCAASLAWAKHKGASCAAPATMTAHLLEGHLDAVLRSWASTHGTLVLGEPGDAETAEQLLTEAEDADAEVAAYVRYTPARVPGYADGLREREEVATAAWEAYRDAAQDASTEGRVVNVMQLVDEHEPERWGQLVRDVVRAVEVTRGRGPVEGRVRVVLRDGAAPELPELPDDAGAPMGELPELTDADAPQAT